MVRASQVDRGIRVDRCQAAISPHSSAVGAMPPPCIMPISIQRSVTRALVHGGMGGTILSALYRSKRLTGFSVVLAARFEPSGGFGVAWSHAKCRA